MENRPRISKKIVTQLPIGAYFCAKCDTAREFEAAYQNALHIRRTDKRTDGGRYKVNRDFDSLVVTVSVIKEEEDTENEAVRI